MHDYVGQPARLLMLFINFSNYNVNLFRPVFFQITSFLDWNFVTETSLYRNVYIAAEVQFVVFECLFNGREIVCNSWIKPR